MCKIGFNKRKSKTMILGQRHADCSNLNVQTSKLTRKPAGDHVGVADRFDLVRVVFVQNGVHHRVERVE